MVILQTLHGVGERERDVHLDLIVGLVGAVTACGGTGAEMHGRQGLVPYQLVGVVGDAMLVQVLELFGVAAGLVGKDQRNAVVDDGLTAEHILEGFRRDAMSVKTSVSGFQRMTEPVRLPLNGSFCKPPTFPPFLKSR